MANYKELAIFQRDHLFDLLKLRAISSINEDVLNDMIARAVSKMEAEDVAYVQEQVDKIYKK